VDNFVDIGSVTGISAGSLAPTLTAAPLLGRRRKGALQRLNQHCVSRETHITARSKSSADVNAPVLVGFGAFWRFQHLFAECPRVRALNDHVFVESS
jgi:hypothetical protein